MEIFHHNYSTASLELSIAVPGFSSSPSSGESSGGAMKELDINQVPSPIEEEECMEEEEEENDSLNNNGIGAASGGAPRKKLRLTKEQSRLLEETFLQNHTLNPKEKEALAVELKLKARQVEVWFQNRRARSKMKQTEMECEYLKRWFGTLIEQNRRLQKEVEELRAMKAAPPHCRQPLTTHTMCPRCDRVLNTATTTTTPLLEKGPASAASAATATSTTPHYVL